MNNKKFAVSFPVYTTLQPTEDPDIYIAPTSMIDGFRCLAFFTERLFAERFIVRLNHPEKLVVLKVPSREVLLLNIERQSEILGSHVCAAFDPSESFGGYVLSAKGIRDCLLE